MQSNAAETTTTNNKIISLENYCTVHIEDNIYEVSVSECKKKMNVCVWVYRVFCVSVCVLHTYMYLSVWIYNFCIFVSMRNSVVLKTKWTRLILFSNSEPPRLRDVVSHLITIKTTINTHTHTHTHARTHTHTHAHTHTPTPTHTYKQFTNQQQYIRYFVHVGMSAATHRQFFLRQNIFRAFKNNDQIPDTFRILEKYTEKYT